MPRRARLRLSPVVSVRKACAISSFEGFLSTASSVFLLLRFDFLVREAFILPRKNVRATAAAEPDSSFYLGNIIARIYRYGKRACGFSANFAFRHSLQLLFFLCSVGAVLAAIFFIARNSRKFCLWRGNDSRRNVGTKVPEAAFFFLGFTAARSCHAVPFILSLS